jgi:signal transduction histidine kinase
VKRRKLDKRLLADTPGAVRARGTALPAEIDALAAIPWPSEGLAALLEQMPIGVIVAQAPSGRLLLANSEVDRLWRSPFTLAKSIDDYGQFHAFHPDGSPFAPTDWPLARAITAGETVRELPIDIERGDGSRGTFAISAAPLRDEEGDIVAGVVTFEDITIATRGRERAWRQREAVAALSRALTPDDVAHALVEQMRATIRADAAVLVLATADGTELQVAAASGYPEEVMQAWERFAVDTLVPLAVTFSQGTVYTYDSRDAVAADFPATAEMMARSGAQSLASFPVVSGDRRLGAIGLSFQAHRVFERNEVASIEVLADQCAVALERARLYEAELRAREEAERLSAEAHAAVRARDEFLSIAAHELKTPITSLTGYAQLILRQLDRGNAPDPGRVRLAMEQVETQSRRLTELVEQLLDVARLETGKLRLRPQTADLARLASEVAAQFGDLHPGHQIVVTAPSPTFALVDQLRIEQVITNLIENALKFSPAEAPIEIEVSRDGDTVILTVRDRGPGVSPDERDRIFNRFYQADQGQSESGLGLGLFISRQIVELHEGTIEVEEASGEGARFVVRLPVKSEQPAAGSTGASG